MSSAEFGTHPVPGRSDAHDEDRGPARGVAGVAALLAALPIAAAPAVFAAPPAFAAGAARESAKDANLAVLDVTTTPVRSDGRAAYTVTVRNIGPGVARATEVSSKLGKGVEYAEGPPKTGTADRTVTTRVGDVPAGTTVTVTIRVRVDPSTAEPAPPAGTSSVRSTTEAARAPSRTAAPMRFAAPPNQPTTNVPSTGPDSSPSATPDPGMPIEPRCIVCTPVPKATSTPSARLLPAPGTTPAPRAATPRPTVTVTVTRTPSASPTREAEAFAPPAGSPSTPAQSPTVTRTLYAVEPPAPPPAEAVPVFPPEVRPPHDLALPPPQQNGDLDPGTTPSIAPPPARTATAAQSPVRPVPRAQAAPTVQPDPPRRATADHGRRHTGLAAEVRDLLPFTGLPLALLAGAAGILLLAGILAARAARRRSRG